MVAEQGMIIVYLNTQWVGEKIPTLIHWQGKAAQLVSGLQVIDIQCRGISAISFIVIDKRIGIKSICPSSAANSPPRYRLNQFGGV
jgi:hypothetical protein